MRCTRVGRAEFHSNQQITSDSYNAIDTFERQMTREPRGRIGDHTGIPGLSWQLTAEHAGVRDV